MRLLLIRHGSSLHAQRDLITVETCPGLAPDGHAQAGALSARLASGDEAVGARLLSSPVARARQTAEPLRAALRVEVEDDPDLRELLVGEADGMTKAEYAARYGRQYGVGTPPDQPFSPGGESFNDFDARVRRTLDRLAAENAGRTVVAVTHAGVIVIALLALLRMADGHAFLQPGFTGITELTHADGGWRLERYNDTSHLYDRRALGQSRVAR